MQSTHEYARFAPGRVWRRPRFAIAAMLTLVMGIAATRTIPHCICAARHIVARIADAPDDNISVPRPAPSQALVAD